MQGLGKAFFISALIYGALGMLLGLGMAMTQNHGQMPTHAHIMVIGWVSFAIFGLFYSSQGHAVPRFVARLHFWLAQVSLAGNRGRSRAHLLRAAAVRADRRGVIGSLRGILLGVRGRCGLGDAGAAGVASVPAAAQQPAQHPEPGGGEVGEPPHCGDTLRPGASSGL